MSKQTLCILTDYMVVGGVERVICDTLEYLSDRYEVTIVLMTGGIEPEIERKVAPYARILKVSNRHSFVNLLLHLPIIGRLVLRLLVKERYDISLCVKENFLLAANGAIAKKTVFWNHGDKDIMYASPKNLNWKRKLNRLRLMLGYHGYDMVWVLDDYIKERIDCAFHLKNTHVLPNPIDCTRILSLAEEYIDASVYPKDRFNIVAVGRLSEEKGQLRLIKAIEKIKTQCSCQLVLVGNGPAESTLKAYVQQHSLTDDVVFAGMQENPYPYIKHASVLVLPSYQESFGLVLLEAMLLGTPVLTTDTTGGRNITQLGKYGTIVESSETGIAEGILAHIANRSAAHEKADIAIEYARKFDRNVFAQRIGSLLSNR